MKAQAHRRAAALLAALHPADRRSLLKALPGRDRKSVSRLISEHGRQFERYRYSADFLLEEVLTEVADEMGSDLSQDPVGRPSSEVVRDALVDVAPWLAAPIRTLMLESDKPPKASPMVMNLLSRLVMEAADRAPSHRVAEAAERANG